MGVLNRLIDSMQDDLIKSVQKKISTNKECKRRKKTFLSFWGRAS